MRQLGLDVGDKRIGVAISDETGTVATGLPTIERVGPKKDPKRIMDLVKANGVQQIVVGLPKKMDGTLGPQAEKVMAFIEALREAGKTPVVPWDERLTSVVAEEALIEAGASRRQRKGRVDQVAAILILQNYLDYRKLLEAEGREPAD